jgi:hypothetical protein
VGGWCAGSEWPLGCEWSPGCEWRLGCEWGLGGWWCPGCEWSPRSERSPRCERRGRSEWRARTPRLARSRQAPERQGRQRRQHGELDSCHGSWRQLGVAAMTMTGRFLPEGLVGRGWGGFWGWTRCKPEPWGFTTKCRTLRPQAPENDLLGGESAAPRLALAARPGHPAPRPPRPAPTRPRAPRP